MRISRIKIAKPDIVDFFDNLPEKILTRSKIKEILNQNKKDWRLTVSMAAGEFINFLLKETKFKKIAFEFPSRTEIRYTWDIVSPYEVILSLRENSYFSHYTALFLHQLTEQIPKIIYLNSEQSPKPFNKSELNQSSIDLAFRGRERISKKIARFQEYDVCIVNGKHTGLLGVIDMTGLMNEKVRVTGLERTLIDATVRPGYSGGVFEVLNAYRLAAGKISVNKLAAILKKLDYTYPYHQAIGFYLEKSGAYKASAINLLRKFEMKYDFYLTYQMQEMSYSKEWRLYFPKGL